jgi:hypothetical protein
VRRRIRPERALDRQLIAGDALISPASRTAAGSQEIRNAAAIPANALLSAPAEFAIETNRPNMI